MPIGLLKAIKIFGSQRALAEALGVKQQAISNWLNRESKIPYPQVIKIVCLTKGAVRAEELAPGEVQLNKSFYEMVQDCASFQLASQSTSIACQEQDHKIAIIVQTPTPDDSNQLELLLPFYKHAFITLLNNNEGNNMTREYSKISPQFWVGKTGREILKLSVESRFLAFYLMTCPHANMVGIYYLPIAYIAHDIKIDINTINQALSELIEVGFCSYDFSADYVWVHEIAKYQITDYLEEKDKRVKGINDIFRSLPDLVFLKDFYEKYQEVFYLDPREEFFKNEDSPDALTTCVVNEKTKKGNKHEEDVDIQKF